MSSPYLDHIQMEIKMLKVCASENGLIKILSMPSMDTDDLSHPAMNSVGRQVGILIILARLWWENKII